jgi:hypothetical protein
LQEERDPRISEIFYYFERHTSITSGRTVGRKIGVIQELMCKRLLLNSELIRDSIIYEPRIRGFSGATHKVEFVLFQPLEVLEMEEGQRLDSTEVEGLSLFVSKVDPKRQSAAISLSYVGRKVRCTVSTDKLITSKNPRQLLEPNDLQIKAWIGDDQSVRLTILNLANPVASIESKRVGAQRFSGTEKLGSGIQTIEKAKQASLVAVDFDLKYNGTAMAIRGREAPRPYRSFVILGNGVHWTDHDLSVLDTYVDYTYLVRDSAIVRYAEYVREKAALAGEDFFSYFMAYFKGLTNTVADDFEVRDSDFVPVRPNSAAPLQDVLKKQFVDYPVNDA